MVIIKNLNLLELPVNFIDKTYNKFRRAFVKNYSCHRYYGPAYIYIDGYKSWHFNYEMYGSSDNKYNQKQFIKDLNKQWLL